MPRLSDRISSLVTALVGELSEDASGIVVCLPSLLSPEEQLPVHLLCLETGGHRVYVYAGAVVGEELGALDEVMGDRLRLEWDEPSSPHRRVDVHVSPVPLPDPYADRVYDGARHAGATVPEAGAAARESASVPASLREVCLRLLADGTPWARATELAALTTGE